MTFRLILLFLSIPICTLQAQIVDFSFYLNFIDDINGHVAMPFGEATIESSDGEQVLRLEGDEYLRFPRELHESIDFEEDLEIQIRFKITDTYDESPFSGTGLYGENGKRILMSNKGHNIQELGFEIYTELIDGEYRLLMSFGDGTEKGGTWIFYNIIDQNEWIDLRLILRMNKGVPDIIYKINGDYNHFPLNYLDVSLFKQSLNSQQIWVGTDKDNGQEGAGYSYAETLIDFIRFYNPIYDGKSVEVQAALGMLKDHLVGNRVLTLSEQTAYMRTIVQEWDDDTYSELSADILDYISTYETIEGTAFEYYTEWVDPAAVVATRGLQFMLIQYLADNGYTHENVSNMAGVQFLDHELFPGPVSAAAPRISGSVTIDGTYNTSPGYFLNQQYFVIRPTGYYAAPGEIVQISVPSTLVDQGVKVHVGAHFVDLREDYFGYQRFPTMATKFPVDRTTMDVANPFGGAIYFTFPDGSNFGGTTIQFDNAVKSPYYSLKTGYTNSLTDFQTEVANAHVYWADVESDHFMATFPRALAEITSDVHAYFDPLNQMIGNFNIITGRPFPKIRSEYMISEPQSYTAGTLPAAYPISIVNGDITETDPLALPISAMDRTKYINTFDGPTLLHELGHLHSIPTMDSEGETNVDIATVMAYNVVFDMPLDSSISYAVFPNFLSRDLAALDWILDPKFRKRENTDFDIVSYQARGQAKYTDVAGLFSWDTIGLIHKHWYDQALLAPDPATGIEYVSQDEYIQVASDQLGFNFAPLWEIWGSIPSQSLVDQLHSYPREVRIKDRILHYRALVPRDADEFLEVYNIIAPMIEPGHAARYDDISTYYDEEVSDSIFSRIDDILCTYFETNCQLTSIDVELDATSITLLPNPTEGIFEIVGLMEDYSIKVIAADGTVVKSVECTGHSGYIDISELPAGLLFVNITNKKNELISVEKIIKQ